MHRVVLGGGIASGKSTVSGILTELGAEVLDMDAVAADVRADPEVASRLTKRFGVGILGPDGKVVPSELAQRAFADACSKCDLDAIMHPEIARRSKLFLQGEDAPADCPMRVVQVPLVTLSTDLNEMADEVVVVSLPAEIRLERAVSRGMDPKDARQRIMTQASDEDELLVADTVIDNTGTLEDLRTKVLEWWDSRTRGGEDLNLI